MPAFPSVNLLAVLVAAVVSFVSGGIYWRVIASPLTKLLGGVTESVRMPTTALIAGFLTRVVVAYVVAIFLSYAGARSVIAGAAIAVLACCGFVLTYLIGQATFRQMPWTRLVVGAAEVMLGFVLMGAIIGAWA